MAIFSSGLESLHVVGYSAPDKTGDCQQERTTLMEAYLSFICVSDGDRFETGLDADRNGEWLSVQMERLRSAWLSFQVITGAQEIQKQPSTGWGPRFGLPRLEVLQGAIDLPRVDQVWRMIQEIPGFLAGARRVSRKAGMWRRWAPGNPGSQMIQGGTFVPPYLWELPCRRLRRKRTPPPWRHQVRRFAAFHRRLEKMRQDGVISPDLMQLILQEGALDPRGLQVLTSRAYYENEWIKKLLQHNSEATNRRLHVVGFWGPKERPSCIACGRTGFASRQMTWVVAGCKTSMAMKEDRLTAILAKLRGQLQRNEKHAAEVGVILRNLKSN